MSDPAPLAYGRDRLGRFVPGNQAGKGRAHPFARQAAALRRAFFEELTPADMRALVRTLVTEASGGNLQAARLVLLWVLGKPHDPIHPDVIQAAVEAAEGWPESLPDDQEASGETADRDARMDQAVRLLAQEIRRERQAMPVPGDVVDQALNHPI